MADLAPANAQPTNAPATTAAQIQPGKFDMRMVEFAPCEIHSGAGRTYPVAAAGDLLELKMRGTVTGQINNLTAAHTERYPAPLLDKMLTDLGIPETTRRELCGALAIPNEDLLKPEAKSKLDQVQVAVVNASGATNSVGLGVYADWAKANEDFQAARAKAKKNADMTKLPEYAALQASIGACQQLLTPQALASLKITQDLASIKSACDEAWVATFAEVSGKTEDLLAAIEHYPAGMRLRALAAAFPPPGRNGITFANDLTSTLAECRSAHDERPILNRYGISSELLQAARALIGGNFETPDLNADGSVNRSVAQKYGYLINMMQRTLSPREQELKQQRTVDTAVAECKEAFAAPGYDLEKSRIADITRAFAQIKDDEPLAAARANLRALQPDEMFSKLSRDYAYLVVDEVQRRELRKQSPEDYEAHLRAIGDMVQTTSDVLYKYAGYDYGEGVEQKAAKLTEAMYVFGNQDQRQAALSKWIADGKMSAEEAALFADKCVFYFGQVGTQGQWWVQLLSEGIDAPVRDEASGQTMKVSELYEKRQGEWKQAQIAGEAAAAAAAKQKADQERLQKEMDKMPKGVVLKTPDGNRYVGPVYGQTTDSNGQAHPIFLRNSPHPGTRQSINRFNYRKSGLD